MKVKKPVKKAQSGDSTKAKSPTLKEIESRAIDLERERVAGPGRIDTAARSRGIKEGLFKEDPKTGDLYPTEKYKKPGRIYPESVKKSKTGSKLMKKAKVGAKVAKKAKSGAKMMKSIKKPSKKK